MNESPGMKRIWDILDCPNETVLTKIEKLAQEAIETAQKPIVEDQKVRHETPVWIEAKVLFDFSLGFLALSCPSINETRDRIIDVFCTTVIAMQLKRIPA